MIKLHSPYLETGYEWLKGNLHTHTTLSDGALAPEPVLAKYEAAGYDFLAISDHDIRVAPETYQPQTKLILIPADEVTRDGPHVLAVGISTMIEPTADRQKAIDSIIAQGGFAVLNHPCWREQFNHYPQELMEQLTGYAGIEIYNGAIERLPGNALATDRWDRLLSTGRRAWGFANDDFHEVIDFARGWIVVQAQDRQPSSLCEALKAGRFYASTGVTVTDIHIEGDMISVNTANAQRIRFIGQWGREWGFKDGNAATYQITGEEGEYVRVECFGSGAQMAWTQPIWIEQSAG